tara:strand:+ start:1966 stop:4602 length:2637 start_codon:yes stop_codon:yes gene_type:complete
LSVFLFLNLTLGISQEKLIFSGIVNNNQGVGLEGTTIVLYPLDTSKIPCFGVSKSGGKFVIKIEKNTIYTVNITFMGFEPIKKTLTSTSDDINENFLLKEASYELEEVVIKYTPPIVVKKDTTNFRTDEFVNGKERKLGAVLKKLPGVTVNRDGEVFFKNKKVEMVLVENKTFFTGQTKMATENIPADVVSEVQMIEDYTETSFLKEFEGSDNLVMNIKLKEGKKKFFFGDLEAALGYKDRYRFHPSVFKYSPTVVHNFIGDVNNTQSRSFSLQDYLSIEGDKSPESLLSIFNSPFAKFLKNEDYFKNDHLFGGYNFQYNPDTTNELRIFTLGMADKSFRQDSYDYTYQASQVIENRLANQEDKNTVFFGKLKYKYTPDIYTVVKLDVSYNKSKLNNKGANSTFYNEEYNEYGTANKLNNDRVLLNLSTDKWFSNNNVSTAKLDFLVNKESLFNSWESLSNIFSSQIPLNSAEAYTVTDDSERKYTNFDFDLKHHYRPIRTNMISFGFNGKIYKSGLQNISNQIDDNSESIKLEGFENDFNSLLTEINNSITSKWYVGNELIFDFGLVFQNIFWKDSQILSDYSFNDSKLLPVGKIEWNFNEKKSLKLSYNTSTSNPESESRLSGSTISDFNLIATGYPYVMQPVSERLLLSLSLYRIYGLSFYSNIGYRKQKRTITQSFSYDGINGYILPFQLNRNVNSYDIRLRTKYNRRYWKISFENSLYKKMGISVIDGLEQFNNSLNINNILEFFTNFEEAPNVEFEIKNSFLEYNSPLFSNTTLSTDIDFSIMYDYKDWKFDFSIFQNFYNNRSLQNRSYLNLINTKVFYHKEDSPIEIGLDIYNLGNNKSQTSNKYNTIYFTENNKRLFPRTIMFNINYKL